MNIREYLIRTAYENEETRGDILPLISLRTASEEDLISRVIKLAYANPEIRDYVLPFFTGDIFKEAGRSKAKKTKNRGNKGEKRKQNRADKRNKKDDKNKKDNKNKKDKKKSKLETAIGVPIESQSEFERSLQNQRVEISEAMEGSLAVSTAIGYALDEASSLHEQAKKAIADLAEKWNKQKQLTEGEEKAVSALKEGGAQLASEISAEVKRQLVLDSSQDVGIAIDMALEEASKLDEKGSNTLSQAGKTLTESIPESAEELQTKLKAIGKWGEESRNKIKKAHHSIFKKNGLNDAQAEGASEASSSFADMGIEAFGSAVGLSAGGAVAGAQAVAMAVTSVAGVSAIALKGVKGIAEGIGGLTQKGVGKGSKGVSGLKSWFKSASEEDIESLKQKIIEYYSTIDADQIDYLSQFVTPNGFDLKAFQADMKKQTEAFHAEVKKNLDKAVSEAKKEKGEEAKREVEVVKDELGEDAFVAKTAVVKLAYENPKYRPQLLQLLQVPRSHYALADIRACLSN
jgi:hypothetical protein